MKKTLIILLIVFLAGCTKETQAIQTTTAAGTVQIALLTGHGESVDGNYDSGALSADETIDEASLNIELATMIKEILEENNVAATVFTENVYSNMMYHEVTYDFTDYDYVLEIHFNALDEISEGSEIYVSSENQDTTIEESILDNLSVYFKNRGVYVYNDYKVIRTVYEQGISSALLEVAFMDNDGDLDTYLNNQENVANAIANALLLVNE